MASFDNHIKQAKSNLLLFKFLSDSSKHFDWQVTACYYVGVHLVNAHLAAKANSHFRTHNEVKEALNPLNPLSVYSISEDIYILYLSLEKLSRMARYLCDEAGNNDDNHAFITKDKHVLKAVTRLNKVLTYFKTLYPDLEFDKVYISCPRIKAAIPTTLEYFQPFEEVKVA